MAHLNLGHFPAHPPLPVSPAVNGQCGERRRPAIATGNSIEFPVITEFTKMTASAMRSRVAPYLNLDFGKFVAKTGAKRLQSVFEGSFLH